MKALFKILKNSYNMRNIEGELNSVRTTIAIGPRTWQELEKERDSSVRARDPYNHRGFRTCKKKPRWVKI